MINRSSKYLYRENELGHRKGGFDFVSVNFEHRCTSMTAIGCPLVRLVERTEDLTSSASNVDTVETPLTSLKRGELVLEQK